MCETDDHKPQGGNTHGMFRDTPSPRDGDGRAVNEQDRDLLILLGSVGIGISQIATGLFEDSLGRDEQVALNNHLKVPADHFRHRALGIPLIIGEDPT